MAAETPYRKDPFTATFLPAMALKVLNRAEVNAAKKGYWKDRDYKFTGSSQRSKDDGFPMWFRANVCKGNHSCERAGSRSVSKSRSPYRSLESICKSPVLRSTHDSIDRRELYSLQ